MNVTILDVIPPELCDELCEMCEYIESHPMKVGDNPEDSTVKLRTTNYWEASEVQEGHLAGVKQNLEAGMGSASPFVQKALPIVANHVMDNQVVKAICLTDCLFPPRFNRYGVGDFYEEHCDEPLARDGQGRRIRSDLAYTLFLSNPDEYEGGELVIRDGMSDPQTYKGEAGSMVVYPSLYVHKVNKVVKGTRFAVVGWIQSLIADPFLRSQVYRVNTLIETVNRSGDRALVTELEAHRNTLIRLWST